ncbi:MAG: hypothetical protein ACPG5B_08145 [Chitinophagales bacterium]
MMTKTTFSSIICLILLLCFASTTSFELKAQEAKQASVSLEKVETMTESLHLLLNFSDSQYAAAKKINEKALGMMQEVKNKYKNSEMLSTLVAHEQQQIGEYRDQKLMRILAATQKTSLKQLQQTNKNRLQNENAVRYEKLIAEHKQLSPAENLNNNQYKPLSKDKTAVEIDINLLEKAMQVYDF